MSTRGHFPEAGTRSARDSDGSADSSWIGVFSRVSRPARFLMQRYLPGRAQTAFDMKSDLDIGNSLMGGLADPSLKVAHLRSAETPAWMTSDSLSELEIRNTARKDLGMQTRASVGNLVAARKFLSPVLNASSTDAVTARSANSWWSGLWGVEESPQNWLLNVPQSRKETGTNWQHCREHHSVAYCQSHSLAAVAVTTELFVCRDDGVTMHSKSTGSLCSYRQIHNASVLTAKPESLTNSHMLTTLDDEQKKVFQSPVCSRTFSEVAVLTPDQDIGYSSWEEEQSNSKFHSMKLLSEVQQVSETDGHVASGNGSSQSNTAGNESVEQFRGELVSCKENIKQAENDSELCDTEKNAEETSAVSPAAKDLPALPTLHCQNKAIAYIMGSPCSDESESEGDDDDQESDDEDGGFDSEGSSHFSESEDSEDSDDESEDEEDADSETERLWNSLCQNRDPYSPMNFTAPLRTVSKPTSAEPSVSESPPACVSSLLSPPPSSPILSENESSEEACEMDEENLRLWNSFSCSADPYSLLNFQAPIQNQKPPKSCQKRTAPRTPHCKSGEAEERLDSGFSEISPVLCSNTVIGAQLKKVQFVEEVEEFYISSDEDRHGPWEEIARDRCRFQRRVQEVEETISYCLSPAFRLVIFQRLYNTS